MHCHLVEIKRRCGPLCRMKKSYIEWSDFEPIKVKHKLIFGVEKVTHLLVWETWNIHFPTTQTIPSTWPSASPVRQLPSPIRSTSGTTAASSASAVVRFSGAPSRTKLPRRSSARTAASASWAARIGESVNNVVSTDVLKPEWVSQPSWRTSKRRKGSGKWSRKGKESNSKEDSVGHRNNSNNTERSCCCCKNNNNNSSRKSKGDSLRDRRSDLFLTRQSRAPTWMSILTLCQFHRVNF